MIFWPRFLEPLVRRRNKNIFAAVLLEPCVFLFWGSVFGGLGLFGAPRCLDPALKQGTKKVWGPALYPALKHRNREQKKPFESKRGAPKSAGPVAYAASAIWFRHCLYVKEILVFSHFCWNKAHFGLDTKSIEFS
jgi:hypothetical protein